jgi:hypothetical protein
MLLEKYNSFNWFQIILQSTCKNSSGGKEVQADSSSSRYYRGELSNIQMFHDKLHSKPRTRERCFVNISEHRLYFVVNDNIWKKIYEVQCTV